VTQSILVEGRLRVRIWTATGEHPAEFSPVKPTLEDAYLVLTGVGDKAFEGKMRRALAAGAAQ